MFCSDALKIPQVTLRECMSTADRSGSVTCIGAGVKIPPCIFGGNLNVDASQAELQGGLWLTSAIAMVTICSHAPH